VVTGVVVTGAVDFTAGVTTDAVSMVVALGLADLLAGEASADEASQDAVLRVAVSVAAVALLAEAFAEAVGSMAVADSTAVVAGTGKTER